MKKTKKNSFHGVGKLNTLEKFRHENVNNEKMFETKRSDTIKILDEQDMFNYLTDKSV